MLDRQFIDYLADKLNTGRKEMVEKDIVLQNLLCELAQNKAFKDNFAFKGGTCLIKCYLGYYRFSEDLDFTFVKQEEFKGKSEKQIRRAISEKISSLIVSLEDIANRLGLEFKGEKGNKKYVELGGSNRFVTFKLWYTSPIFGGSTFIKIQINFIEKIIYAFKELPQMFILDEGSKEIEFLFPKQAYLFHAPILKVYDLREILTEKVRAILTRKGTKARDFIDVFLIVGKNKIEPAELKVEIIDKIRFMLRYENYQRNIKDKIEAAEILLEEETILLIPLPKGFPFFLRKFNLFLQELVKELLV